MCITEHLWPLVADTRSRLGRDPYFSVYLVHVEALVKNSLAHFILAAGSGVDWISMFRVSKQTSQRFTNHGASSFVHNEYEGSMRGFVI